MIIENPEKTLDKFATQSLTKDPKTHAGVKITSLKYGSWKIGYIHTEDCLSPCSELKSK